MTSVPVSRTAIRTPLPVMPWFQSWVAPMSAGVPFVWSTSGSASVCDDLDRGEPGDAGEPRDAP